MNILCLWYLLNIKAADAVAQDLRRMLGPWAAPVLFEIRQWLIELGGPVCTSTLWGVILFVILLAFLMGCCCGAILNRCRRLLNDLLRTYLLGGWAGEIPRLTPDQRPVECRQHRA